MNETHDVFVRAYAIPAELQDLRNAPNANRKRTNPENGLRSL